MSFFFLFFLFFFYFSYTFHVLIQEGIVYLCLAEKTYKTRNAFQYLRDIREKFVSTYGEEEPKKAIAYAMNDQFARILKQQMVKRKQKKKTKQKNKYNGNNNI